MGVIVVLESIVVNGGIYGVFGRSGQEGTWERMDVFFVIRWGGQRYIHRVERAEPEVYIRQHTHTHTHTHSRTHTHTSLFYTSPRPHDSRAPRISSLALKKKTLDYRFLFPSYPHTPYRTRPPVRSSAFSEHQITACISINQLIA